jgi:hypothetical protein
MQKARWRWALVPMVVVVAGCLPHANLDLPASFLAKNGWPIGVTFTAQTPPTGQTGQDVIAALVADNSASPMFRGRVVPVFGVIDCHGNAHCLPGPGGEVGRARTVWVLLYPDCTDGDPTSVGTESDPSNVGYAVVDALDGIDPGTYTYKDPCDPHPW